jgi:hypothetical protein
MATGIEGDPGLTRNRVASPALAAGTWTVINPPDPPGTTFATLNSVFAASPAQAWAVGEVRGPASGDSFNALIGKWNGSTWSIVPGANVGPATSTTPLYGVSGSGPDDVWAVGQDSAISPSDVWALGRVGTGDQRDRSNVMEHWNGSQWSVVTLPASGLLNSISAVSASDVWAVGNGGLTEQWNGTQWNSVPPAASIPAGFSLSGFGSSLGGVTGGPLFAVGGSNGGGNNEVTILEQTQPWPRGTPGRES